jgi:hypothetical protein
MNLLSGFLFFSSRNVVGLAVSSDSEFEFFLKT